MHPKWRANQCAVTVKQNDADAGTVTGTGMYNYDSNVTVTATTNPGYNFLGWYDKDGNLVSENRQYTFKMGFAVTYTAKWDYYTVTVDKTAGGSVTSYNDKKVSVGETVKLTATTKAGYTFIGWYNGETKLTDELIYTFTMSAENVTYTAKWIVKAEMSGFHFTSTSSTCTITGIKDTTVTDIVVPDYVTSISSGAFRGCSSLESITIPFVGDRAGKTSSDTYQYPFGYIFGTSSYTGGTATTQDYYGSSTGSTTSTTFYIPRSLRKVTVTGGNILRGAFYNCNNLTSVTIGNIVLPDELTSLTTAFRGKNISSITLNNNINSIPASCFRECYELEHLYFDENLCFSSIDSNAFYSCNKLTGINLKFSGSGTIGMNAFYGCHSITSATLDFSNCTTASFGRMCFASCRAMEKFYFEGPTFALSDSMFSSCVNLKTVVLNTPSMVTGRASAFSSSLIATSETEGYIYVPDSLVDTYTANSVWSTYASKIKPLSELLA